VISELFDVSSAHMQDLPTRSRLRPAVLQIALNRTPAQPITAVHSRFKGTSSRTPDTMPRHRNPRRFRSRRAAQIQSVCGSMALTGPPSESRHTRRLAGLWQPFLRRFGMGNPTRGDQSQLINTALPMNADLANAGPRAEGNCALIGAVLEVAK
jgi:hypothetical protein